MTAETKQKIYARLSAAAGSLKLAGELETDAAAKRVREIRDAIEIGDDVTGRRDLADVLKDLHALMVARPHGTSGHAVKIEKQEPVFLPGVEQAIHQIEKALELDW